MTKLEPVTDMELARKAIEEQYAKHLFIHAEEWLVLQMKRARPYSGIYGSDVPECPVCVAYGTALKGLADARQEREEETLP